MRIALFTDTFPPHLNGVSTYVHKLAEWMGKKHEVAVFTIDRENSYEDTGRYEIYRVKGVTLKSYPDYNYRVIPPYRDLLPVVREFSPDVIHSHSPITMGAVAELASRRFRVPLISHFHTALVDFVHQILDSGDPRFFYTRLKPARELFHGIVDKISYPAFYYYYDDSDAVISPSEFVTTKLVENGVERGKIIKIPNFISIPESRMSGEEFREKWGIEDFMVLHVGRLSWEKRIERAIEAVRGMDGVTLVITSKGPYRERLMRYASRRGVKNVVFTGFLPQEELFGAYEACDVFITPSPYDTFNISAAQALAFGKPVIGFRSGITEFVKHGVNGFIADSFDGEVESYRQWIEMLRDDEELKRRMGKESARESKRLKVERIMPEIEKLYRSVRYEKYKRRRYIYYFALFLLFIRTARI